MRRFLIVSVLAIAMMLPAGAAIAAPGGMPAAHGVDGKTFGAAVSNLAKADPGALAAHVSGR